MGKQKVLMLTFHNAMSMTLVIDNQEVTVRDCPAIAFTQWVSKVIEQHSDKAAIEKELSNLSYAHKEDKWFCLNVLKRRNIRVS